MVKLIQPAPPILLLVVERQLPRLSTVLQHHPPPTMMSTWKCESESHTRIMFQG